MSFIIIFFKSDASIKKKQGRVKNSFIYLILDSDISVYNDDIISHYAYCSFSSTLYLTFLSSATSSHQDSNGNWITGRRLYVLCIDANSRKIMPISNESISEEVIINIFYVKGKV